MEAVPQGVKPPCSGCPVLVECQGEWVGDRCLFQKETEPANPGLFTEEEWRWLRFYRWMYKTGRLS